jgi:hypothetical protein
MKVHSEWRNATDLFDIWVWQDTASGRQRLVFLEDGKLKWQVVEDGDRPEPSITFPGDVWDQLHSQATGILPASASMAKHLEDAIKVRDRLLDKVAPAR